jgi:hypothetical protein
MEMVGIVIDAHAAWSCIWWPIVDAATRYRLKSRPKPEAKGPYAGAHCSASEACAFVSDTNGLILN